MRKALIPLSIMALLFSLPLIFAATPIVVASPGGNGSGTVGDPSATFPQSGIECDVSASSPTCTIYLTVQGSGPVSVNVEVMDGFLIGDVYNVSVDGVYSFTTSTVQQPTSLTVCTQSPAGDASSCAAQQAAGDIVQTNLGLECDLGTAYHAGLSVGDTTVSLSPGIHNITVTDVAPVFTGSFDSYSPASFCVNFDIPPSLGIPQFPLGLPLLLGASIVGLALVRKKVLPSVKRTI